ncbi:hypothetical protein AEA09_05160 [Lysinibacillus contaminans]|uniref:DUF1700 domain-containing protein n=1 Tax=Lysinibacillus contaminans TaxID=1293441 RepID=A0ABR5JZQ7_9BACI|nr:hypothetical protein [Lysinibacillus contaminans]KOS68003.1 hypothetical protein AEA09_05160 [Lysinibacillus contaminans]
MTNPRKKIILNEILFWKQNKLLPEHYCDFLTTLYAEGNELEAIEEANPNRAVLSSEKRKILVVAASVFIGIIALLFVYFTVPSLTLILSIVVAIAAIVLFIVAFQTAKTNGLLAPVFHVFAAILLFCASIQICTTYFSGNNLVLFSLIAGNCIVWLWSGIKMRLLYFTISGVLGLVVLIGYYVMNLM